MATDNATTGSASEEESGQDDPTSSGTAKKATAKRSAGRTSTAKKPTRSSAAKKSTTKKSTTKKSTAKRSPATKATQPRSGADAPRVSARQKKTASMIAASAARQLLELTGKQAEGVTGLERFEEGWIVQVEVVEVRRIPDTTDVLALYEVEVDPDGEMVGYRRVRRYTRGAPGSE